MSLEISVDVRNSFAAPSASGCVGVVARFETYRALYRVEVCAQCVRVVRVAQRFVVVCGPYDNTHCRLLLSRSVVDVLSAAVLPSSLWRDDEFNRIVIRVYSTALELRIGVDGASSMTMIVPGDVLGMSFSDSELYGNLGLWSAQTSVATFRHLSAKTIDNLYPPTPAPTPGEVVVVCFSVLKVSASLQTRN